MNKNDAISRWIDGMQAISSSTIELVRDNSYLEELTPERTDIRDDCCYHNDEDDCLGYINERSVHDDDFCEDCELLKEHNNNSFYTSLPMWGTLWQPESFDQEKIRNNLEEVRDCGFRIYETNQHGVIIGIDGAGYNFYDQHWLPLYNLLGLKWHDEPYRYECVRHNENGERMYYEEEV